MYEVIHLHQAAPGKPDFGQPCNGCGVCCSIEPCPIGAVISGRKTGPCDALVWNGEMNLYRCGLLTRPSDHLPGTLRWLAPLIGTLAPRYISAGSGCDCSYVSDKAVGEHRCQKQ